MLYKRTHYALIAYLLLPFCSLNAMSVDYLEADPNMHWRIDLVGDEWSVTPRLATDPLGVAAPAQAMPKNIDSSINPSNATNKNQMFIFEGRPPLGNDSKKRKGPLDEDDEPSIPRGPRKTIKPSMPEKQESRIPAIVNSINKTLTKESLRKFTYDMELMKSLNEDAYQATISHLEYWREKDADFLNRLTIKNGTPDIIRVIESQTSYRFPENIVVRKKEYPCACSLAEVACLTEARVKEHKNALVDSNQPSAPERDKIYREIPTSCYLIQTAIIAYLDELKALKEETPEQARERMYQRASEFLFQPKPEESKLNA